MRQSIKRQESSTEHNLLQTWIYITATSNQPTRYPDTKYNLALKQYQEQYVSGKSLVVALFTVISYYLQLLASCRLLLGCLVFYCLCAV